VLVALTMSNRPAPSSSTIQAVAKPQADAASGAVVSGSHQKVSSSAKPLSSFDKSVAKAVGGKLKLKTAAASNSGIQ
jgi:hypothetical protein